MNLAASLERHAAQSPDKLALIFKDQLYTYREYDEESNRIANGLRRLGVERGDRVAIMLPNRAEFLFTFYGILKLGAIEVSVNILLKGEETRYILDNTQAKVVVVDASRLPVVQAVRDHLPDLRYVVVVGGEAPEGTISYETLTRDSSPALTAVQTTADERAVIAFTSGTTGVPKGAVHTHEAIDVQLRMVSERIRVTAQDVSQTIMPIFSLSVLIYGPMIAVHNGCTCCLMERYSAVEFVRQIKKWQVSLTYGVATVWIETSQLPEDVAREVDFSSLRIAMGGAAPIPQGLREDIESRYSLWFIQGYGMTEAPCIVSTDLVDRERKPLSVGLPLPHIRVKIVDDDDNELPTGQVGEICAGPHSAGPYAGVYRPLIEYWRAPETTAENLKGGFLHTGDLGYLDEDGFVYIVDRKKDMIIRGGHNVYPKELENVLYEDPRVVECAVVGMPHERLGEVPKAYIKLRSGAQAMEQEFIDVIRDRLAKFKALEEVEFVDDFPRNALGKILKRELSKLPRTGGGTAAR